MVRGLRWLVRLLASQQVQIYETLCRSSQYAKDWEHEKGIWPTASAMRSHFGTGVIF
jgi:hypothetical protein